MSFPLPRIYPRRSLLNAYYRAHDALGITAPLVIMVWYQHGRLAPQSWLMAVSSICGFSFAAELTSLYRSWHGATARREIGSALVTWMVTVIGMLVVAFGIDWPSDLSRLALVGWLISVPMLLGAGRLVLRGVLSVARSHGLSTRRCAIVGVNPLAVQLARNLAAAPQMGLSFAGFYDDRPEDRTLPVPADLGRRVGDLDELVEAARCGSIETIYLTFPLRAEERLQRVLERLGDTTASVHLVPDLFMFELLHARWSDIGGLPVVSVFEHPFYGVDGILKRLLDLVAGSLALMAAAIPMAVIAVLIKLTSHGPVFFRQQRYGMDGREIRVWKFRSMTVCEDGVQVAQATRHDHRVTPVGAVLRRTSLDELPQLFNVLVGSMSLVGPRPHAKAHNEQYRMLIQGYMLRHKIKPGITGLAQVNGFRGETDTLEKMQKRVEFDLRYIREWSLGLDLKILAQTVRVVLSTDNAY